MDAKTHGIATIALPIALGFALVLFGSAQDNFWSLNIGAAVLFSSVLMNVVMRHPKQELASWQR